MIAVIADDFTGAAEIGGIGLRNGLNVVIETGNIQATNADLLIIAADTRSLQAFEAAELIVKITEQLLKFNPTFIFKKIDSVLRGNITEELIAQIETSHQNRSVIIAANPIFKRIIRDGVYYIDNIPLAETWFSSDPEYPVRSSSVLEILGSTDKRPLKNLKCVDILPDYGLIVGDVKDMDDLQKWSRRIDDQTLPAGSSGFFNALLEERHIKGTKNYQDIIPFGKKALYVLGSTFPNEPDFLKKIEENGHYLSNMPDEIYSNKDFNPLYLDNWADDIVKGIHEYKKVIASIVHPPSQEPDIAIRIRENIGELMKKVMERIELNELLIEGGSTTSVVLKYLNINKLIPIQELDVGVIRMKIDGIPNLCITTKPGSYFWPESVLFLSDIPKMDSLS
jgi:uncharacterized protein YgbK (DUF1537 family)